eukprot:782595-Rhodomonas_salina.1
MNKSLRLIKSRYYARSPPMPSVREARYQHRPTALHTLLLAQYAMSGVCGTSGIRLAGLVNDILDAA